MRRRVNLSRSSAHLRTHSPSRVTSHVPRDLSASAFTFLLVSAGVVDTLFVVNPEECSPRFHILMSHKSICYYWVSASRIRDTALTARHFIHPKAAAN
ncbi:unnamed protein product [Danaus chrysippus]|uniref:(African queen) hypothetical protein n=1 Tax=Danaus chrysippus TaxID=151541 RepID=A0A8J2W7P8_9NEOP|nr:unnamed protein product [Danaus chrysippus]